MYTHPKYAVVPNHQHLRCPQVWVRFTRPSKLLSEPGTSLVSFPFLGEEVVCSSVLVSRQWEAPYCCSILRDHLILSDHFMDLMAGSSAFNMKTEWHRCMYPVANQVLICCDIQHFHCFYMRAGKHAPERLRRKRTLRTHVCTLQFFLSTI